MYLLPRQLEGAIAGDRVRGRSLLLLGPRQTGKTTLIQRVAREHPNVLAINLLRARDRDRYSVDPDLLLDEIEARLRSRVADGPLLLLVDEVQRVPRLLDALQLALDTHKDKLVALVTGSSARKLRRGQVNLLPGRLVRRQLLPLTASECAPAAWTLRQARLFGRLPGIITCGDDQSRRDLLESYVDTYLQEEIREEALVRNYGAFRAFLSLAAERSGTELRYEGLAQRTGVAAGTIRNFYGILFDTLLAFELPPIQRRVPLRDRGGRRLSKTAKVYLFDNGIVSGIQRRWRLLDSERGLRLEQLVLLDLLCQLPGADATLGFWRQHQGHEVDFVIDAPDGLIGIEVKSTRQPGARALRGLLELHRLHGLRRAYVACEVDRPMDLRRHWAALKTDTPPPEVLLALPAGDVAAAI